MATATRSRSFLETKAYPLDMDELIPTGAILTGVQMTASRMAPYPLQGTQLAAPIAVGDSNVSLQADPRAGALLIIEPGSGAEEKLKVVSVSGSNPWVCSIRPVAWAAHSIGASVSYEPGMNARLFLDDTPTPAGTVVTPIIRKGCAGQSYRISYLGSLNNGEDIEDEFTLSVVDKAAAATRIKQPSETRDLAADFAKLLNEAHQAGATLSSAVAYVSSSVNTATTTLAAQAAVGDPSVSLNAHPGVGALLILSPAGSGSNPPERAYVSAVIGSGPYSVTLTQDLEFGHANGNDVTVYQGFSAAFLSATTSTIQGLWAVNRSRRGQAGKTMRVVWVATTSQAELLSITGLVDLVEL